MQIDESELTFSWRGLSRCHDPFSNHLLHIKIRSGGVPWFAIALKPWSSLRQGLKQEKMG